MAVGGLYIPMPHHVNIFCLSPDYGKCHQYVKGCELLMIREQYSSKDFVVLGNRRKMKRFTDRFDVILAAFDQSGMSRQVEGFRATTLDISLGGLRMEAAQGLPADSIVGFELESDQLAQGLPGVGQVKWCVPRQDSGKFEIGLSFCNDLNTTNAIKRCLAGREV